MSTEYTKVGQGPAKLATEADLINDETGYTNPNLHRRIDPQERPLPELLKREYELGIYNVNSYRTTTTNYHDEDSSVSEIP